MEEVVPNFQMVGLSVSASAWYEQLVQQVQTVRRRSHPRPPQRGHTLPSPPDGPRRLPWQRAVTYVGLRIYHRLSCATAANAFAPQKHKCQRAVGRQLHVNAARRSGFLYRFDRGYFTHTLCWPFDNLAWTALSCGTGRRSGLFSACRGELTFLPLWSLSLLRLERRLPRVHSLHRALNGTDVLFTLHSRLHGHLHVTRTAVSFRAYIYRLCCGLLCDPGP